MAIHATTPFPNDNPAIISVFKSVVTILLAPAESQLNYTIFPEESGVYQFVGFVGFGGRGNTKRVKGPRLAAITG